MTASTSFLRGGIEAKAYTRMRAAIRHLSMRLNVVNTKNKLLITLSDSKSEDSDGAITLPE